MRRLPWINGSFDIEDGNVIYIDKQFELMFSLFKRKNKQEVVPKWASFFNAEQYQVFITSIDHFFAKRHLTYVLGDGELVVDEDKFGFGVVGLMNTAQACYQSKTTEYKNIVAGFFDSMIKAHEFDIEFKKISGNFDKVKDFIAVRFYNKDYVSRVPEDCRQGKDFAGDIFAMLVFDFPNGVTNIKSEDSEKWGKSLDQLFELGLQNIRRRYQFIIKEQKFFDFPRY